MGMSSGESTYLISRFNSMSVENGWRQEITSPTERLQGRQTGSAIALSRDDPSVTPVTSLRTYILMNYYHFESQKARKSSSTPVTCELGAYAW